jgi:ABC-type Fe3+ transport system permease subunit
LWSWRLPQTGGPETLSVLFAVASLLFVLVLALTLIVSVLNDVFNLSETEVSRTRRLWIFELPIERDNWVARNLLRNKAIETVHDAVTTAFTGSMIALGVGLSLLVGSMIVRRRWRKELERRHNARHGR